VHSRTRQPTVSLAPRATTAPRDELHRVIEQFAGRSPDRGGRHLCPGGIFARVASLPGWHLCPGGDDQRGGELAQAAALGDGADARLASRARLALGHGQRGALMARLVDRDIGAPAEGEPPVHVAYIVPLPIRANTAAQIRL
jgi:hypothetical protein